MAQYAISIYKSFMYRLHLWVQITTYCILPVVKVSSRDPGGVPQHPFKGLTGQNYF